MVMTEQEYNDWINHIVCSVFENTMTYKELAEADNKYDALRLAERKAIGGTIAYSR